MLSLLVEWLQALTLLAFKTKTFRVNQNFEITSVRCCPSSLNKCLNFQMTAVDALPNFVKVLLCTFSSVLLAFLVLDTPAGLHLHSLSYKELRRNQALGDGKERNGPSASSCKLIIRGLKCLSYCLTDSASYLSLQWQAKQDLRTWIRYLDCICQMQDHVPTDSQFWARKVQLHLSQRGSAVLCDILHLLGCRSLWPQAPEDINILEQASLLLAAWAASKQKLEQWASACEPVSWFRPSSC